MGSVSRMLADFVDIIRWGSIDNFRADSIVKVSLEFFSYYLHAKKSMLNMLSDPRGKLLRDSPAKYVYKIR